MKALIIRNTKVFFRDKSAVFFSLLSVFIIIGLYAFFLGDVWVNSLTEIRDARFLMDSWIMAGVLSVTSITTTMGAFGIMVDDRVKKISKDFYSSPVKKSSLAGGYILSSYIIGVIMSIVALVLIEIYIVMSGGQLLSLIGILKVLGLILLSTLTNTALVFFMVSFFKSLNAFSTASTIIGTLIGFLTGIYMPVGQLPDSIQVIVKVFPVSHSAALFRQIIMAPALENSFAGAPANVRADFEQLMGVVFKFGNTAVRAVESYAILIATAIVFYLLAVLSISRKKNR
ncbi:MAG: ABC transporter permease [Clostridiales bacterium]|nr:ABC transporter permease [Clostridiales bacterium]